METTKDRLIFTLRYIAETIPQAYHAQGWQTIAEEMIHAAKQTLAAEENDSIADTYHHASQDA